MKLSRVVLAALSAFPISAPVSAQIIPIYSRAYGTCSDGNKTIITAGVASSATTPVIRSYPSCTVTVYSPGTTTPAVIFSDSTGTPKANPFTANTTGNWFFYGKNGSYDVRLSGGGIPTPFTLGDIPLFNIGDYHPELVLAYAQAGNAGVIGAYNPSGTFYSGFTTGPTTSTMLWTLPSADGVGCLSSNGSFVLSFVPCGGGGGGGVTPGGVTQSIQFNNGSGGFGGDGNLLWDGLTKVMSATGTAGTPVIRANGGYILANGGIVSNVGSWQGFNTDKDGGLFRGMHIAQSVAGNMGGYVAIAPITYDNFPAPLTGLASFGLHNGLLWVSGTNPAPPDITNGLNTNLYINAAGGFATGNSIFNSIQAPAGGVHAKSLTATNYIQSGSSNGPPSTTTNDAFHPGALYYDTAIGAEQVYTGAGWVSLGSGGSGGGSPGGSNTSVQFKAGPTTFGGDTFFFYNTTQHLLTVNALDSTHAGMAVGNGYMQADAGFLSGACTRYNCFQAASNISGSLIGGMAARSFSATTYIEAGNSSGIPTATTGDTFNAGAMFWDTTGAGGMKVYNGSAWVSLAGGSGAPGGSNTSVQFNSSGTFGGDTFFFYNTGTHLVTVVTPSSTTAGLAVGPGYIQSDAGFLSGSCNRYNCFQATSTISGTLTGGMAAVSFTATKYVQAGNYTGTVASGPPLTTSDTFQAGALSYNTTTGCLAVYSGSAWGCTGGGGGSGTPGGANTNVQYNNSGSFGGSGNFIWNNTLAQLTITGIGGSTDTMNAGANYVNSLDSGVAGHTLWALAKFSGAGILKLSNGTGTGGIDGNGATILATATDGQVQGVLYKATNTATNLTFANSNANFLVNGAGAVSAVGVFSATGPTGGFNVTNNNANNSFQSTGGINLGVGGTGFGGLWINGSGVINGVGYFVGPGVSTQVALITATSSGNLLSITNSGTGFGISDTSTTGSSFYKALIGGGGVTSYKALATTGQGIPAIHYATGLTGQTAAISTQQITIGGAAPAAGWYRVSMSASCRSTGASPTGFVSVILGAVNGVYQGFPSFNINCDTGPYINTVVRLMYTDGTTSASCNGMCWSTTGTALSNAVYEIGVMAERIN